MITPPLPSRRGAAAATGERMNFPAGGVPAVSGADPAGFASLLKESQRAALRPEPPPPPPQVPRTPPTPPAAAAPAPAPAPQDGGDAPNASASPDAADDAGSTPGDATPPTDDRARPAADTPGANRAERAGAARPAPPKTRPSGSAGSDAPPVDPTPVDRQDDAVDRDLPDAATAILDPTLLQAIAMRAPPVDTDATAPPPDADPSTTVDDAAGRPDDALATRRDRAGDTGPDPALLRAASPGAALDMARLAAEALLLASAEAERPAEAGGPDLAAAADDLSFAAAAAAMASSALQDPGADLGGAVQATATLAAPVGTPAFADELGLRLGVFVQDGIQQAELHLNPAELGPVSVLIALDGTRAQIDFGADAPATRQAIEAGLPQLAGALRDAGFTLTGGGVSQQGRGHGGHTGGEARDGRPAGFARIGGAAPVGDATLASLGATARRIATRGGLDLFA